MISKELKIYLIIFAFFFSGLLAQYFFFYGFQDSETIYVNTSYYDRENPQPVNYEIPIIISKPKNTNSEKNPAIIILHGDYVDLRSINSVKLEFLQSNYYVVSITIDFTLKSFFELNSTLDYLLTRSDINSSQIGIVGHSHGSNYAFLFAWMRNNSIACYVGTNPGPFGSIYQDYFEYFRNFVDLNDTYDYQSYIDHYIIDISDDNPRNMLISTNIYNPQRKSVYYNYVGNLTLWDFEKQNELYGNFNNGTARKILIKPSIFLHASGIYDPSALFDQVEWVNQAFSINADSNIYWHIALRVVYNLFLVVIINISGLIIFGKLLSLFPSKIGIFRKIYIKIRNKMNFGQNKEPNQVLKLGLEYKSVVIQPKLANEYGMTFTDDEIDEEFDSYSRFKNIFGVFISLIIGGNIFIYTVYFIKAEDLVYMNLPSSIDYLIDTIYILNDRLGDILYFGPLSFGIVYIWFLIVFFNQQVTKEEFHIIKVDKKTTFYNLFINIISLSAFLSILWLFGTLTLILWSGFNLNESFLNYFLRFSAIFYFNFIALDYYQKQTEKIGATKSISFLKLVGILILLYFPLVTVPDLHSMYYYIEYYWFYYIPFIFQIIFLPIFIIKKVNLYILSFVDFYLFLLWQVTVFF